MRPCWTEIKDDVKLVGYEWADLGDGEWRVRKKCLEYGYILKQTGVGVLSCECKGYVYNNRCKHQSYMMKIVTFTRVPRDIAELYLNQVIEYLGAPHKNLLHIYPAGSYLRGRATVKDLDCVVWIDPRFKAIKDAASTVNCLLPSTFKPILDPKSGRIIRGKLDNFQIDLYLCWPKEFGAMMMFLTGPVEFNIFTRRLAQKKGYRLSQYGLYLGDTKTLVCDCSTEECIFEALGLNYVSPVDREEFAR